MKIIDTFIFNNELEHLEIRLNQLKHVVDLTVLVESPVTFSNQEKPLYYLDNKDRFKEFNDKIIFKTATPLMSESLWDNQRAQENEIIDILEDVADIKDIILFSDVDEHPFPERIIEYAETPGLKILHNYFCYYYADFYRNNWHGTRILNYEEFLTTFSQFDYHDIRFTDPSFPNTTLHLYAGWHLSGMGGVSGVLRKMNMSADINDNPRESETLNQEKIQAIEEDFKNLRDPLNIPTLDPITKLPENLYKILPRYILDNKEKFADWFYFYK